MKMKYLFAAAATIAWAAPGAATIVIFTTPGAVQPEENVLFAAGAPTGTTAMGFTNQSNTEVTFTGIERLATPSNGQARLEARDGGLSQLGFALTNPDLAFTEVEFNIFGARATATSVTLNFTDQFGKVFSRVASIGSGQNFFSARAIDDQFITNVSFTLNGDVADVRQFRIGGIGEMGGSGLPVVPEPATWALLIVGFGMVGTVARRRRESSIVSN